MSNPAITTSGRVSPPRNAPVAPWPVVIAFGLAWYGAFALSLFGQALGLL